MRSYNGQVVQLHIVSQEIHALDVKLQKDQRALKDLREQESREAAIRAEALRAQESREAAIRAKVLRNEREFLHRERQRELQQRQRQIRQLLQEKRGRTQEERERALNEALLLIESWPSYSNEMARLLNEALFGKELSYNDHIARLPRKKVRREDLDALKEKNVQCTVCMSNYEMGDIAVRLPCRHYFHKACIVTWLKKRNSCPLCRDVPIRCAKSEPGVTGDVHLVPYFLD